MTIVNWVADSHPNPDQQIPCSSMGLPAKRIPGCAYRTTQYGRVRKGLRIDVFLSFSIPGKNIPTPSPIASPQLPPISITFSV